MLKQFGIILLGCTLPFTVSGCGLQGPLEPPHSSEKNMTSDKGQAKNEKEDPKPQRGFFLDRLLR